MYEHAMQIRTDGKFAYREELAEILSTRAVDVEYEVSTGVSVE